MKMQKVQVIAIGLLLIAIGLGWYFGYPVITAVANPLSWVGVAVAISGAIIVLSPFLRAESPVMWVPLYEFLVMYFIVFPLGVFGWILSMCGGLFAIAMAGKDTSMALSAILPGIILLLACGISLIAVQAAKMIQDETVSQNAEG